MTSGTRFTVILVFSVSILGGIFFLLRRDTLPDAGDKDSHELSDQSYEKFELRGTSDEFPPGVAGTSDDYPSYVSFEYPSEFSKESLRDVCEWKSQTCIQVEMDRFRFSSPYSKDESMQEWYTRNYGTEIRPETVTAGGKQALRTVAVIKVPAFESKPSELAFIATLYVPTEKGVITFEVIPFVDPTNQDNQKYASAVLDHIIETLVIED